MLQANPNNNSVLTVSPPDSGFIPRPEFARDSHVPSTFALLSIAGTSSVRLSSFSHQLLSSLRFALKSQSLLRTIREEPSVNLVEYTLEGKPWAQRKNPNSEKLFVQILAIIFQHGYRFLSTIDYGREQSERVCIAFSRPAALSAHEAARTPFALSFPSSKVLRVINPPLNSTPAILAAARNAWPRGVTGEKTVSNGVWEFRLKGYGWFQEDTFAIDSMQHILALLNALDRYAFTLLTSISLTGSHSRVKDLWIFSGSPMEPSSDAVASNSNIDLPRGPTPNDLKNALTPVWSSSSQGDNYSADTLHGKGGSLGGSSQGSFQNAPGHARSATEPNAPGIARSSSVLRKKSSPKTLRSRPFGQPPFSRSSEEFPLRGQNLSPIGSVNMTGIGTANQQRNFVAEPARNDARSPSPKDFPRLSTGSDPTSNAYGGREERARVKTGELFYETGPAPQQENPRGSRPEDTTSNVHRPRPSSLGEADSESQRSSRQFNRRNSSEPPDDVPQSVSDRVVSDATSLTPPLLGPRIFRDSAFSSSTTKSCEIPIAWTGPTIDEEERDSEHFTCKRIPAERIPSSLETDEGYGGSAESGVPPAKRSSTPKFPGAWQPSPISEVPEDQGGLASPETDQRRDAASEHSPERRDVDAERVASPVRPYSPEATRKSEVALIGTVTKPAQLTISTEKRRSANAPTSPTKADGWVLVNIADGATDKRASSSSGDRPKSPSATKSSTDLRSKSPESTNPSLSPLAKAIVVEDAKKPIHEKSQSASGLKRFLSGSRAKSRQAPTSFHDAAERTRKLSLRERWLKKTAT
ncbi:hypothetical protein ACEPAH_803 [Sanghuangporus vaninii]